MPVTVRLLLITVVIESAVALLVGAWSGVRRGGAVDQAATMASTIAIAVPLLVLASVSQYVVAVRWHLLPASGTTWAGLLLPALVLALPGAAIGVRIFRSEILERRHDHHVTVAMGKGLGEWTVARRHVLRNSLMPLLTFLALDAAMLVGGAIVVERVFNLPGIGGLTARAISQRDTPLIVGVTLVSVAVFLLVDLLIDVVIMSLDPRLRSQS
jgi:oligopeptide transport system permease protein